ncbi:MAG: pyrroline-5-carboxylate reductase [Pseudomonadota bacterium]
MNVLSGPILLVGFGKMGAALLHGWLDHGLLKSDVMVVEPSDAGRQALADLDVAAFAGPDQLPSTHFRAVIFAVKPQIIAGVLPAYQDVTTNDTLIISIAAGTAISRFERTFGGKAAIVRAMPNTPAAIGQGVTALFANANVSDSQKHLAEALMSAVGLVQWLDNEEQMHAVTAMSGGGPAYVFLLIETLAKAGMANGLPETLAWPMARATVIGSGALAAASQEPAATLRCNVTSPGGTTEAALSVLMSEDSGVQPIFDKAIQAASGRSRELA